MDSFWVVWNPNGRTPTIKHTSHSSARCEATRLAGLNPGTPFFVLESVGFAEKVDVKWTDIPGETEIPF